MTDDPPKTEAEMRARWERHVATATRHILGMFYRGHSGPPFATTLGRKIGAAVYGAVECSAADTAYVMGRLDEYDRIMGVKSND